MFEWGVITPKYLVINNPICFVMVCQLYSLQILKHYPKSIDCIWPCLPSLTCLINHLHLVGFCWLVSSCERNLQRSWLLCLFFVFFFFNGSWKGNFYRSFFIEASLYLRMPLIVKELIEFVIFEGLG